MKRGLLIFTCGLAGILFGLLVPYLMASLTSGWLPSSWVSSRVSFSEDQASEAIKLILSSGVLCFFPLGTWLGSLWVTGQLRVTKLLAGLGVAAFLSPVVLFLTEQTVSPTRTYFHAVFLFFWASSLALLIYGVTRRQL